LEIENLYQYLDSIYTNKNLVSDKYVRVQKRNTKQGYNHLLSNFTNEEKISDIIKNYKIDGMFTPTTFTSSFYANTYETLDTIFAFQIDVDYKKHKKYKNLKPEQMYIVII
jgi:hypothetical protein